MVIYQKYFQKHQLTQFSQMGKKRHQFIENTLRKDIPSHGSACHRQAPQIADFGHIIR